MANWWRFDRQYVWRPLGYWSRRQYKHEVAHKGRACRILRRPVMADNVDFSCVWVVFDDGYITIATPSELNDPHPYPEE